MADASSAGIARTAPGYRLTSGKDVLRGVNVPVVPGAGDRVSAEVAKHTRENTDALVSLNEQQLAILQRLDHIDAELDLAREHRGDADPRKGKVP